MKMTKTLLAVALAAGVSTSAMALDITTTGSVGAVNRVMDRGLQLGTETPAVVADAQVEAGFVRAGVDAWTTSTNDTNSAISYDTHVEVFTEVAGQELSLGVKTADYVGTETETYVGATGDLVPTVGYEVTAYRSNQTRDIFVDMGVSKEFGDYTVGGNLAYADYVDGVGRDGFEYATASVAYGFPYVTAVDLSLTASYTTALDDNSIRGTEADDKFVVGVAVNF